MKNKKIVRIIIYLLPIILVFISLFIGRYQISINSVLNILKAGITGNIDSVSDIEYSLIWDVRMPRTILAILVGGSLGISGAALQGLFRNPLVDSGILGVSSGAGFGAALAIIMFSGIFPIYLFSFAFSLVAVILSIRIGRINNSNSAILLVLGGVIISSIFSSLISFLKFIADPYNELPSIIFWLMGSLANASYREILISAIPMLLGISGLLAVRWKVNVLSMGEREAQTLGINIKVYRWIVIIFSTLATAGAVAVCGIISWIGLVIPHIGRMIVGNDNRYLMPVSIALGGFMLLIIDDFGRILTGGELPLNILTALIGGPFYIYLLKKTKEGAWR
ncbi:iron ABC transporter permease [Clostridiaceae bacterium HSG29]|nr:iron ABC transporter permease [Clostridiaceae bacterium HSG29]